MPTTTTTYSFNKPVVGADEDDWGGYLNGNWDSVDDLLDGTTPVTGIDINSGTLDGVTIGGTTAGAGTFTTLTANTSITGTLATAAQPNITSVGSLTSLGVSGDLTVDTNTLYVDSTNNRVGIGTSSPATVSGGIHAVHDATEGTPTAIGDEVGIFQRNYNSAQGVAISLISGSASTSNIYFGDNGDIDAGKLSWSNSSNSFSFTGGNVGIGTTSPTEGNLVVRNDSGNSKINIKVNDFAGSSYAASLDFSTGGQGANDPQAQIKAVGANNYSANLIFSTQISGTTNPLAERMRIDSSGNVGIGTSSPSVNAEIRGSSSNGQIRLGGSTTGTYGQFYSDNDGVLVLGADAGNNAASSSFRVEVDGTERMRIDSSGNVGIGTTTSAGKLTVDGTVVSQNAAQGAGNVQLQGYGATSYINHSGTGSLIFRMGTGYTERMRIDSSGNLLVGKTSSAVGTAGHELLSYGRAVHTVNASTVQIINRLSNDGDMTIFQKDGSTVGSIYNGGGNLGINSSGGLLLVDDIITPTSANDATYDIGRSLARYKDLYLSGGVYLGGTGAANKLDDYEEGTWTVTIGSGTMTTNSGGAYTKIGNLLHFTFVVSAFSDISSSDAVKFSLPFTAVNSMAVSCGFVNSQVGISIIGGYVDGANLQFYANQAGSGYRQLKHSDFIASNAVMHVAGTLRTTT